jgi:hypothetical protein
LKRSKLAFGFHYRSKPLRLPQRVPSSFLRVPEYYHLGWRFDGPSACAERRLPMQAAAFVFDKTIQSEAMILKAIASPAGGNARVDGVRMGKQPDLDVRAARSSLKAAVACAAQNRLSDLANRLRSLLRHGSKLEQISFVFGESRTYFFPQDIRTMVRAGPNSGHRYAVHDFCWTAGRQSQTRRICLILGKGKSVRSRGRNREDK